MQVDMKKIEIWLEEKILYYLGQRSGRLQRMQLVTTLSSNSSRNWHWDALTTEQPGWPHVGDQKRRHRVNKVISRMVREHKVKVCSEAGEERSSADYTMYIHRLSLLDRIARHLAVDDG